MSTIDKGLEAVKQIADALTPLGIDVVGISSLNAVEYVVPGSEALRIPEATVRYKVAKLTIHIPFTEYPATPESSDTSQEHGSR
jgi:hypothetical protein